MSNAFNLSQLANFVDSSGKLNIATGSTGTLPLAQGGTNNGSLAATAGGVLYTDGSKVVNVGAGTSGQVLQSNGAGAPAWATPSGGGVTSLNGQTGAITNTTQYAIGSYILGRPANISTYDNSTIAGSSLYAMGAGCYANFSEGTFNWRFINFGGSPSVYLVNTGSWRCVSAAQVAAIDSAAPGLWVRYA